MPVALALIVLLLCAACLIRSAMGESEKEERAERIANQESTVSN
jgi:hypothetical protein